MASIQTTGKYTPQASLKFKYAVPRADRQVSLTQEVEMPGIRVRQGETVEQAWRYFKKQIEAAGVLNEIKRRQYYDKPSIRLKKKRIAAQKRARRRQLSKGFS